MSEEDSGPKSDIDRPVEEHIQEMLLRSLIFISVILSVSLIALPFSEDVIEYLWNYHIPDSSENQPVLYSPLSLLLTRVKVVFLAGLMAGLPVLIYQAYKFMEPGLYDIEKTYFKFSSLLSFGLSSLAIVITHFILIPIMFFYFSAYTEGVADIAFGLQETVGLMVIMMIYIVIIFQMPILIGLAVSMGVISRRWIARRRLIFWGLFFGIAFLSSPDPTGMAPVIIGLIMLIMFEITLFGLKYLPKSDRHMKE